MDGCRVEVRANREIARGAERAMDRMDSMVRDVIVV